MASEEDMKLFFSEAEDLIQTIEDNILAMEEDHSKGNQCVQNLFFAYHTLKGLTAMVNLENLSKFTHQFENFMDKNKNFQKEVQNKTEFINLLFKSLDVIRSTIVGVKRGEGGDLPESTLEKFSNSFDSFEGDYEITFFKPMSMNKIQNALKDKKNNFYKIYIQIQSSCAFKKVRLFIIFRALNQIGRIISSEPEPGLLEQGNFEFDFTVYFMSKKSSNDIMDVLNEILEIENKVINKIKPDDFLAAISEFYSKIDEESTQEEQTSEIIESIETSMESFQSEMLDGLGDFTSTADIESRITSVKVDIEILEQLMDYFGELVILKNQLNQFLSQKQNWGASRFFDNMDKLFLEIQEIIFKLKLVRVESKFRRYKRLVRDVAKDTNKKVDFRLSGMDTEIDRKILEQINTPLLHLLRNAIYHGIEDPEERLRKNKSQTGVLELKTYRRASSIYIEVSDDGAGIDHERIRRKAVEKGMYTEEEAKELTKDQLNHVIFSPGFSTLSGADMISGRGMGLAIVAEKIRDIGGNIEIESKKDVGSSFILTVPFTRAILKAQLIKTGGDLFAIPVENIQQIYFFKRELIEYVKGEEYYRLNNKLFPVIRLSDYLEFEDNGIKEKSNGKKGRIAIHCIKDDLQSAVFIVDEIMQQLEVVIKPFRTKLSRFKEILGTTITGDGTICLIIDVINIISSLKAEVKEYKMKKAEVIQ